MSSTKLILDIGNTRSKMALFEDGEMVKIKSINELFPERIANFISGSNTINNAIISSVTKDHDKAINWLKKKMNVVLFKPASDLPVKILYKTPETLGADRLAGIVGAWKRNPGKNSLVIDAGTTITMDIVNKEGEYLGGSISPGLDLRFRSLNKYTNNLPLLSSTDKFPLIGSSTEESIYSGVQNGVIKEIEGIINEYKSTFDDLQVLLTGGDHSFFDSNIKNSIFVAPYLVLEGLNEILDYQKN